MTVDPEQLKEMLYQATRFPWKYEDAYNNAGMPTADFYIPGHNGGATVEILAADAALIVKGLPMLQELLELYDAAIKFKDGHYSTEELSRMSDDERKSATERLFVRRDDLLEVITKLMPEESYADDQAEG